MCRARGCFFRWMVLDIAASLAAELEVELAGFFIEDQNLLRAAALPFTRDVGVVSGTPRPMRLQEVERALRSQAQALKSSLAATAGQSRLRWSFTTVAGAGIGGAGIVPMLDVAIKPNLTVLAPRGAFLVARTVSPRSLDAHMGSAGACVGVVYNCSREALDAVRLAALIARSRAAPLVVIRAAAEDRPGELQRYARDTSVAEVPALSCVYIEEASAAKMAEAAREVGAALLVVPVDATSPESCRTCLPASPARSCR